MSSSSVGLFLNPILPAQSLPFSAIATNVGAMADISSNEGTTTDLQRNIAKQDPILAQSKDFLHGGATAPELVGDSLMTQFAGYAINPSGDSCFANHRGPEAIGNK